MRYSVVTEGAFVHDIGDFGVGPVGGQHETRVVWTGRHACTAAYATLVTLKDEAAFFFVRSLNWAGANARRIVTVIAEPWQEVLFYLWIGSCHSVGHPGAKYAQRHIEFGLTGHHACVASYTTAQVYNHCKALFAWYPPGFNG